MARSRRTIVAGPWLSEVGFEILYWRPFLAWFTREYRVPPERLIAVSRGGAGSWYEGLCGSYIDVFEAFNPSDLKRWQRERETRQASQKQLARSAADQRVLHDVLLQRRLDPETVHVLPPSLMYTLFRPFWDGRKSIERIRRRTVNHPLPTAARSPIEDLPVDYVAFKAYWSDCFPETASNREFVSRLVSLLTAAQDVVLLSTGLDLDDHRDWDGADKSRIYDVSSRMKPATNLDLQSRVIAGAKAVVSTYGGFSYLAPFLGVSSFSFFSQENFIPGHLDVVRRSVSDLRRTGLNVGFAAQHVGDFQELGSLVAARRGDRLAR